MARGAGDLAANRVHVEGFDLRDQGIDGGTGQRTSLGEYKDSIAKHHQRRDRPNPELAGKHARSQVVR